MLGSAALRALRGLLPPATARGGGEGNGGESWRRRRRAIGAGLAGERSSETPEAAARVAAQALS